MQDTNGDSLLVVVGHPLTCGIHKNHLGKFGHIQLGFLVKNGLIVVLMLGTLIFETFVQSAWELVKLRGHVPVPPLVGFQAAQLHHKPSHARHQW